MDSAGEPRTICFAKPLSMAFSPTLAKECDNGAGDDVQHPSYRTCSVVGKPASFEARRSMGQVYKAHLQQMFVPSLIAPGSGKQNGLFRNRCEFVGVFEKQK